MTVKIAKNPKRIRTFIQSNGTVVPKEEALSGYKRINVVSSGGNSEAGGGEEQKDSTKDPQ